MCWARVSTPLPPQAANRNALVRWHKLTEDQAEDLKETARWYRKAQSSSLQDTGEAAETNMVEWLREHAEA